MIKVRTSGLKYKLLVSHTSTSRYVLCTYFLLILVQTFLQFERLHTWHMLTLVEYIVLVPDSIARPPGRPAGLLASDSGTSPRIEANHIKALAGIFTAAWQHPCQCLSSWALALAACWEIQLWRSASPDSPLP